MYITTICVSVFLLACTALAQSTQTFSTVATFCQTSYGSVSVANPPTASTSRLQTTSATYTITSTPVFLYTPPAVTTTATAFTSTAITVTISAGTGVNTKISTTAAVIDTVSASPQTVSYDGVGTVVSGFGPVITVTGVPKITPVLDTLPNAVGRKKRSLPPHRGRFELEPRQEAASTYAQRVKCTTITEKATFVILTVTAPTKTLTQNPPVKTKTVTSTWTETRTRFKPQSASTTVINTTVRLTVTVTPTVTSGFYYTTQTTLSPARTVYPQCDLRYGVTSRNEASKIGDYLISSYEASSPAEQNQYRVEFKSSQFGTPLYDQSDCCGKCLEDPFCAASITSYYPNGGTCIWIMRSNNVCDAANPLKLRAITLNDPGSGGPGSGTSYINNGKCGQFVSSRRFNEGTT